MKRFCVVALVLAVFCGCQAVKTSTRRLGKDLAVVVTSPIHIPVAAATDVAGSEKPGELNPISAPILLVLGLAKHSYFTLAYAADAVLYPVYLPFGAEPWDLYTMDAFPYTINHSTEEVMLDPITIVD
jgi:hypothetical protein